MNKMYGAAAVGVLRPREEKMIHVGYAAPSHRARISLALVNDF